MNKENIFSIGEVSKMFHVSVSSLRHYETLGLLTPEYISSDSGYRYYGPEQFEVLNTIRYLRALDMPLSEIKDFLQNKDINVIEEKLQQQKNVVLEKQQELKRIEQKIEHRLNWLSDAKTVPVDTISLVHLPESRIVWVDEPLKIDGFLDMEKPIRKLDQSDTEAVVFLGKIGLGISAEHLCKAQIDRYDGIFLILDQEDIYTGETDILPETLCVRLRFRGSHTEASKQYKKLLAYIEKHQLQIVGFSREMTLIDYGVTDDPDKFVTEICIPVKHRE
ncbi:MULTISPECIES: MerR family transcriptional regulator [Streptococcus]|uniref:MerR family transcriptional regulator n=1 Tax=Streptococcus TaxID=1301 RepID=UPI0022834FFF|nr:MULTISPECIES: MerR family transcriptional regulator [Streptococcus]MCR5053180.1 MerR family transcriptional regulator [Streptococcus sp.]MCY7184827.1 MerR family transcriptional regulator [Streptococcus gallolyticus subsp. gallolyticus]MCY7188998.1 MerR family transcriptional regulator [Streptococcus gallolyticus subsp. gallolyticus]